MKKHLLFMVMGTLIAMPASAQLVEEPKLYVSAGAGIPTNPSGFTDLWNPGFNGAIGFGGEIGPPLVILVSFDFSYFDPKENALEQLIDDPMIPGVRITDGGAVNIIYLYAGTRYYPVEEDVLPVRPYAQGGLGYFRFQLTDITVTGSALDDKNAVLPFPEGTEDAFGMSLELGVEFSRFFVEAGYHIGFLGRENASTAGFVPIRFGVKVDTQS